jgi:hypothetical protein
MVSVKTPLLSSMRTTSSLFPLSTEILATSARAKLKSAEPSSPTSTCRNRRIAVLQAKREPVARVRSVDPQLALLEPGIVDHRRVA